MKVLLLADEANPDWVSGPLIGWSLCKAIGEINDAHIVTQTRNRSAFLNAGLIEGKDFTSVDTEYIARPLDRLSRSIRGDQNYAGTLDTAFRSLAYYAFERKVWKLFGAAICDGRFDIVHRVTPLSPSIPSIIGSKCQRAGVPFVVGPINGGLEWPKGFSARRHQEREWLSYLRKVSTLFPGYRSTRRSAAAIIVGSARTQQQIQSRFRHKTHLVSENAVDLSRFSKVRQRKAKLPLIGVFVGRLVPVKCVDILLRAARPLVESGAMRIKIVGDGPLLSELKVLTESLGVSSGVEFTGWLAHKDVQEQLINSDFFVLPSVKEFGGGAVLEAMSVGLVPVVADYGGPAELVTDDCGFKIEFSDDSSLEENLKQTFLRIVGNPEQIDALAHNAMLRVREKYTWPVKARQIQEVYMLVVGKNCTPVDEKIRIDQQAEGRYSNS